MRNKIIIVLCKVFPVLIYAAVVAAVGIVVGLGLACDKDPNKVDTQETAYRHIQRVCIEGVEYLVYSHKWADKGGITVRYNPDGTVAKCRAEGKAP